MSAEALDRHFTPAELGKLWGFTPKTIQRLFRDEPGVVKITNQTKLCRKREYVTLRIPAAIAQRVHSRLTR